MICPRCGTEGDVSKSPCVRCGLLVRLPGQAGSTARTSVSPQQSTPSARRPSPSASSHRSISSPLSGPLPRVVPPTPGSSLSSEVKDSRPSWPSMPPQGGQAQVGASGQKPMPPSLRPFPTSATTPGSNQSQNRLQQNPPTSTIQQTSTQERHSAQPGAPVRNVPSRPTSTPLPPVPTTDRLGYGTNGVNGIHTTHTQQPLRPSRLVNTASTANGQQAASSQSVPMTPLPLTHTRAAHSAPAMPLSPGYVLRNGRYGLHELQSRQEWQAGAYEAIWLAQDAQRPGALVTLCELFFPENNSLKMQTMVRSATRVLTAIGRNPHVPTLWDAFSDQGRNFFVFEPMEGESLLGRMRRTGRALPEQEVIECCVQMTEVLEMLAQQSPPVIHGQIRPEYIVALRGGTQFVLTNFSPVLAGGATYLVAGIDRTHLTAYTAPEFTRGVVDPRTDLYALLASAYHAVTGSVPVVNDGGVTPAQRLNPTISPQFDMVLTKGLRANPAQRYQSAAELRQDLLAVRSANGNVSFRGNEPVGIRRAGAANAANMMNAAREPQPVQRGMDARNTPSADGGVSELLPTMMASAIGEDAHEEPEHRLLLPSPESLPPLAVRNDWAIAAYWLVGLLVCLIVLVILSRGFV